MREDSEPIIVFESADPLELGMAQGILEQAGIPFTTQGGKTAAYLGAGFGDRFRGLTGLLVPAERAERALSLLEEAWSDEER